MEYKYKVSWTI